ncbi:hypothetical protein EK21DRAFT_93070 [Setomelanomma holmii]|uniref:Uncharacterized protein n=1 Tax=Setomelanomma holmii TaxID=210430 RepID=A0A9P4LHY1_9PLEO|nr:hypothetical protein EK21DRAFT_93070 [Setomelanomma holmii]
MANSTTYNFYTTTIPELRRINNGAMSTLTSAQTELANGLPITEQEILDASIGDMLPFRMQPVLLAKFQTAAFEGLNLSSTAAPALDPSYNSLQDIIDFFKAMNAVLDSINEQKWNESASKGFDVHMQSSGKTLKITGLAEYVGGFMVPNSYFHLNAIYMLLRSKGFKLGKGVYVGAWMTETLKADFAPLRG